MESRIRATWNPIKLITKANTYPITDIPKMDLQKCSRLPRELTEFFLNCVSIILHCYPIIWEHNCALGTFGMLDLVCSSAVESLWM